MYIILEISYSRTNFKIYLWVQYRWCWNCQHLLIEVCHNSKHYDPHYVKTFKHHGLPNQRSQKVITIAEKKLFPRLGWMRYLKSLIILKHDYGNSHADLVLKHFSSWLLKEGSKSSWPSLDRLWIENKTRPPRTLPTNFMNEQLFKSLMGKDGDKESLLEGQYRFMEHTALAKLDRNLRIGDLPALKYLRGSVMDVKVYIKIQIHSYIIYITDSFNSGSSNSVSCTHYWKSCIWIMSQKISISLMENGSFSH